MHALKSQTVLKHDETNRALGGLQTGYSDTHRAPCRGHVVRSLHTWLSYSRPAPAQGRSSRPSPFPYSWLANRRRREQGTVAVNVGVAVSWFVAHSRREWKERRAHCMHSECVQVLSTEECDGEQSKHDSYTVTYSCIISNLNEKILLQCQILPCIQKPNKQTNKQQQINSNT